MKRLAAMLLASSVAMSTSIPGRAATASFADFDARARAGERLSVVFFGGSLTWSANATEPNRTGFRGLVADWLEARYPTAHFRFSDAAIGGTGSLLGIFRLDRDVLAHKPDLVFLDFSCNDGWEDDPALNLAPTCAYESILRRLVGEGVPVVQMFFTFRFWTDEILNRDRADEDVHQRLAPYRRLVAAYGTGVGDVYRDSSLLPDLKAGKTTLDALWPIDGGHPGDLGYRYFAEAAFRGFERAVAESAVCRAPATPVYGTVADVRRWDPAGDANAATLPEGWTRKPTYRTSLWYDGLSSRWMGDVASFGGTLRSPLTAKAKGNFVGVFGEADERALSCEVSADGETLATFNGYHGAGTGRLFIWRYALLPRWTDTQAAEHEFAFTPLPSPDGSGEFHIGSICTATLVPTQTPAAPDPGASSPTTTPALEDIDHARGH
jgi:lysophospholipase L1-like esterase